MRLEAVWQSFSQPPVDANHFLERRVSAVVMAGLREKNTEVMQAGRQVRLESVWLVRCQTSVNCHYFFGSRECLILNRPGISGGSIL